MPKTRLYQPKSAFVSVENAFYSKIMTFTFQKVKKKSKVEKVKIAATVEHDKEEEEPPASIASTTIVIERPGKRTVVLPNRSTASVYQSRSYANFFHFLFLLTFFFGNRSLL